MANGKIIIRRAKIGDPKGCNIQGTAGWRGRQEGEDIFSVDQPVFQAGEQKDYTT